LHPITISENLRSLPNEIECEQCGLEARARKLLPQMAYDYYAGGANDEISLRENRAAYERIMLPPHMLVGVSVRDMGTTVLGEPVSMPI
jgi:4-hydroxymandelate oxidase